MIRELPRGPFDAYLRAHYFNEKTSVLPRFAMGCGAIFMIRRVRALEDTLTSRGVIAETDPLLLQEMIALVTAQSLDVVSLAEMRRRLVERDLDRRFVCFTFDGAYRAVRDVVFPFFKERGMPFAVYAGTDYLGNERIPWWLALEGLIQDCDRVSLQIGAEIVDCRCRSAGEKQEVYARLFRRLALLDRGARADLLEGVLKKHAVSMARIAQREMLSPDELKRLAQDLLVTIGTLGGGAQPLGELSFDRARQSVEDSIHALEAATGLRPRHLAFPGEEAVVVARDIRIARELDLETGVTSIEGALWPEHARELLALPRIALDNDPATLVRALMLSSGDAQPAKGPVRAAAR